MTDREVVVWDPFMWIFHWLLADSVITAWFIDEPLWLHNWLGYTAATLITLRVIWSFVGLQETRLSSFVRAHVILS
jgi:cytochrome b